METIAQLINSKGNQVWTTGPDETVYAAIAIMAEKNTGALAIVNGDQLIGILSERDYTRKVFLEGKSSKTTLVKEIMTTSVISAKPEQTINECMAIMDAQGFRHMPVVSDEKLVGMLSLKDLVKVVIQNQEHLIHDLETFIKA